MFAKEHPVDEIDDGPDINDAEEQLRNSALAQRFMDPADVREKEAQDAQVFNPVGELVVGKGPKELPIRAVAQCGVDHFKEGDIDHFPIDFSDGPKEAGKKECRDNMPEE